jgi:hypothetical protein
MTSIELIALVLRQCPQWIESCHYLQKTPEGPLFAGRPQFDRPRIWLSYWKDGRGERIRTSGPCLPKTVLYQAELLPDRNPRTLRAGAKARAS